VARETIVTTCAALNFDQYAFGAQLILIAEVSRHCIAPARGEHSHCTYPLPAITIVGVRNNTGITHSYWSGSPGACVRALKCRPGTRLLVDLTAYFRSIFLSRQMLEHALPWVNKVAQSGQSPALPTLTPKRALHLSSGPFPLFRVHGKRQLRFLANGRNGSNSVIEGHLINHGLSDRVSIQDTSRRSIGALS
jgi:hypothetical protein